MKKLIIGILLILNTLYTYALPNITSINPKNVSRIKFEKTGIKGNNCCITFYTIDDRDYDFVIFTISETEGLEELVNFITDQKTSINQLTQILIITDEDDNQELIISKGTTTIKVKEL